MFRNFRRRLTSGEEKKSKEVVRTSKALTTPVHRKKSSSELFSYKPTTDGMASGSLDRTLYSMPMPENVDALTDLIKLHKDGDKFPYVGIVGDEGEDPDSRRARLLAIKPTYGTRHIPEIVVEACPLINTEGEFSMQDLMEFAKQSMEPVQPQSGPVPKTKTTKDFSITKKYIHIRSITALYTPNMSSTADYCGFHIVLNDTRLINRKKCGQSNAIVSNQEGVMEMSCDYCVGVSDLGAFVLEYQLEREIVNPGFQWGTLTFYFNITESDIPFQTTKKTALAVYRMPLTTLLDRETDADKSDIIFTPEDVKGLRELFMKGDIVDVDQPQGARLKKSSYSKSTLRAAPKGEKISSHQAEGWEMMENARKPQVDAMVASVSARSDEEGEGNLYQSEASILETKDRWELEQERLRKEFQAAEPSISIESESPPQKKGILKQIMQSTNDEPSNQEMMDGLSQIENDLVANSKELFKADKKGKAKEIRFDTPPDTRDLHPF